MKRYISMFLLVLTVFGLCACSHEHGDHPTLTGKGRVFEAKVTAVDEEFITIMPDAGFKETAAAMEVGLIVVKSDAIPEVKVGDHVRIDYDGVVTRSIPGQLGEIYSFEVIK